MDRKGPTHSFEHLSWACGHIGGSACVQCFEAACRERDEWKTRAKEAEQARAAREGKP